ncbi:MAG: nitroreductase family protein [Candidatus Cloacimonetes bacterium]|nr:nitroreductase family protein [Candidatus Cloacimonadota bacterium]
MLNDLFEKRRSYRAIEKIDITDDMIKELVVAASKAPSCYNNQPWRFVFVRDEEQLKKLHPALSKGNEWAYNGSLFIAVYADRKSDCLVAGREYFLFDTGMSVMNILLKAVEMDLVVHPIAGYDESKFKEILNIEDKYTLITVIVAGKKANQIPDSFTKEMIDMEKYPSPRKELNEIYSIDKV